MHTVHKCTISNTANKCVFAVVVVAAEDPPHQTGKRLITKCICVVQIDVLASKIVLQDQR